MARGGKRTYTRDANGRFASTSGGGLGAARNAARSRSGRTSTLGARTSLKRSRAKLAAKDPADQRLSAALSARAQKGAVTRGNKGLKVAKVAARTQISGGRKGMIRKPKGLNSGSPTNRRTKNLPTLPSGYRRTRSDVRTAQQKQANQLIVAANKIARNTSGRQNGVRWESIDPASSQVKLTIRKALSNQLTLGGGIESISKRVVKRAPDFNDPAPGSKSSRRRAGIKLRAGETADLRDSRVMRRVEGDWQKKTLGVAERRKKMSPYASPNDQKILRSAKTQRKAWDYLYKKKQKRGKSL